MSKKGQKFKKHSTETKMDIIEKYFYAQGSIRSLEKEYGISNNTIIFIK